MTVDLQIDVHGPTQVIVALTDFMAEHVRRPHLVAGPGRGPAAQPVKRSTN